MDIKDMLLYYTFLHIKGISLKKERLLWKKGIYNLDDYENEFKAQLSLFCEVPFNKYVNDLINENIDGYVRGLPNNEFYRIAYSFPRDVMFLDIETTGLSKMYSYITLIGWVKNGEYKYVTKGDDLNLFIDDLLKTKVIVTFNGSIFDLPFITKEINDIDFTKYAHIDLRFFSKRFKLTGGQKIIEKQIGFKRPKELEDTDGKEAICLWYQFIRGDDKALKKLLKYNYYDILGMIHLFNYIFFKKIYGSQFPKYGMPLKFDTKFYRHFITLNEESMIKSKDYVKKHISNFKMDALSVSFDHNILGIDLTGSETKASGCSLIKGKVTKTCLIDTDDNLIKYIKNEKIDLVSIDSPLSLPVGRTTVFDSDPYREEYGITRYCERALKKRGINVYPALIPSMQRLTKRGISLAKKIRELGIPVIESFPGAAQDVLQIPRKKTDLDLLKKGLIDLGIEGDYIKETVTHDELDAITSAIVGQFYISGYYEGIGNDDEDYLIIPQVYKPLEKNVKVIGVCGHIAAGKTETARYLEKKGYSYFRYSQVISVYLEEIGVEVTRGNLQRYGGKIYSEFGQYWLNKRLFRMIPKNEKKIVIDGIRHPEDIAFLKEKYYNNINIIFIECDYIKREERYNNKCNNIESDYKEITSHYVEGNMNLLKKLSNEIIINNLDKDDLYQALDSFF